MKLCHAAEIALLSTLFVGCAVEGHSFQTAAISPAKSAVYIYRPYSIIGGALKFPVSCGDHSTLLGPGGYNRLVVDPGHLRCSAHSEVTAAVEFDANARPIPPKRNRMNGQSDSQIQRAARGLVRNSEQRRIADEAFSIDLIDGS